MSQSRDVGATSSLPRGGRGHGGQLEDDSDRAVGCRGRRWLAAGEEHGRRSGILLLRGGRGG